MIALTSPCPREGCIGTMIPSEEVRVHFDWDGSAMVSTACSLGCGIESTAGFTWEGFDSSEQDAAFARTRLFDVLVDFEAENADALDTRTRDIVGLAVHLLRYTSVAVPGHDRDLP